MGPNGEYLEARFASSNGEDIAEKAKRALERWEVLRKQQGYANKPIPHVETRLPDKELENNRMVLRVNLRDLPRTVGGKVTKFEEVGRIQEAWPDFRKWAFNENWYGTQNVEAFVTDSGTPVTVENSEFHTICTQVLVDNVRGQAPTWDDESIRSAKLTKKRIEVKDGFWRIEFDGSAELRRGKNSYSPRLYGQGLWDPKTKKFLTFELVSTGMRTGSWPFNNRTDDLGPAPMGVSLVLYP